MKGSRMGMVDPRIVLAGVTVTLLAAACKQERTPQQAAGAPPTAVPSPSYGELLTPADVERVTGLTGIILVPRDPMRGAGGDLNFARGDSALVVMAQFGGRSLWEEWRSRPGYFATAVSGLGDEAFDGPALYVRKGDRVFALASFPVPESVAENKIRPFLTREQRRELANVLVSRL